MDEKECRDNALARLRKLLNVVESMTSDVLAGQLPDSRHHYMLVDLAKDVHTDIEDWKDNRDG